MARPPTRTQSRPLLSSFSLTFFLFLAFISLVKAADESDYGVVIGIGQLILFS